MDPHEDEFGVSIPSGGIILFPLRQFRSIRAQPDFEFPSRLAGLSYFHEAAMFLALLAVFVSIPSGGIILFPQLSQSPSLTATQ